MKKDIELLLCDTFRQLTGGSEIVFKDSDDRDNHIVEVAKKLEKVKGRLKKGKESGNAIIGADNFSFSSLGTNVFGQELTKRFMVWNRIPEEGLKKYSDRSVFFAWAVGGSKWIFNLGEGRKFFRGEYLEREGMYETEKDIIRDLVQRFTNEGGNVLNIELHDNTLIKEVVEEEGRNYIRG